MSRLPEPGGDDGEWGEILNDFLSVEHNEDGTQKTLSVSKGGTGRTTGGTANGLVATGTTADGAQQTISPGSSGHILKSNGAGSPPSFQAGAKADVGLDNVDNTSDADKPVSDATQTALDGKVSKSGDTMGGNLDMDGSQVTNLGTTTNDGDAATKSYTDTQLASLESKAIPAGGGVNMRSPGLSAWYSDIDEDVISNPVDLVVIGDSISVLSSWVNSLGNQLAARYNARDTSTQVTPMPYFSHAGTSTGHDTMGTVAGTEHENGYAGFATDMSNGQACSHTVTCDGVFVVWTAGTGTLTVKDGGSGGSTVATIDTTEGSGAGNITSIDLSTYSSHEIWIGSTGNTTLEGILPTAGNRTAGIRVWRCGHAGYDSPDFSENDTRVKDFLGHLKALTSRDPHVIIATGFNDTAANYTDDVTALVQDIKAITSGSVALWAHWAKGDGLVRSFMARSIAESENIALIDAGKAFGTIHSVGDYFNLSSDNAHPGGSSAKMIMIHVLAHLTGDPVGALVMPLMAEPHTHFGGLEFSLESTGKITISNIFGFPVFALSNNASDTQGSISFYPSGIASLLGLPSASLSIGPGGSAAPDVHLARHSAGVLGIYKAASTLGDIETQRIRHNAGSPESSVSAPVGAVCQDTTNGILYIKESGTGNTGWKALATQPAVLTESGTSRTLALTDANDYIRLTNNTSCDVTVPDNDDVAFAVGTQIYLRSAGAGTYTVVEDTSVTVNPPAGGTLVLAGDATLIKVATDEWDLIGATVAA